jgi:hypothetical protein
LFFGNLDWCTPLGYRRGMSEEARILVKLRKLILHEESARKIGNVQEAAAFAAKIQELLTTHKLDMSAVDLDERQAEEIGTAYVEPEDVGLKREPRRVDWQQDLALAIAKANGCRCLILHATNRFYFVGRTSDRDVCLALYKHFVGMAIEMSRKEMERQRDVQRLKCMATHPHDYNRVRFANWMGDFRRAYQRGFGLVVAYRVADAHEAAVKAATVGAQSTALVRVNTQDAEVKNWLVKLVAAAKKEFPLEAKLKPPKDVKDKRRMAEDGLWAGMRDGEKVALTDKALGNRRQLP